MGCQDCISSPSSLWGSYFYLHTVARPSVPVRPGDDLGTRALLHCLPVKMSNILCGNLFFTCTRSPIWARRTVLTISGHALFSLKLLFPMTDLGARSFPRQQHTTADAPYSEGLSPPRHPPLTSNKANNKRNLRKN